MLKAIIYVACHNYNLIEAQEFCNSNTSLKYLFKIHNLTQNEYFENNFFFWLNDH